MISFFYRFLILFSAIFFTRTTVNSEVLNVFCYYDSRTYYRESQAKLTPDELDPALSLCTHLIYGYAAISSSNYQMIPLNENLDMDYGIGYYRQVTNLKAKFPALKVLLSVGGGADIDHPEKYNKLLESTERRESFIQSAKALLKNYNFDGINLAWQFPEYKPKRIRSKLGHFWHDVKKTVGGTVLVDNKSEEHKQQFCDLVIDMKKVFGDDYMLTASVLPNVNSSLYFNSHSLVESLDFIILHGFDYYNTNRNPKEADYASPLYELPGRNPKSNIDSLVTHWLESFPPEKILLGISTYGRVWKMFSDSSITGIPPLRLHKCPIKGPHTNETGLFSYPEICSLFSEHLNNTHHYMKKIPDLSKGNGIYAFRLPNSRGENGIWISYEDSDSVKKKVLYLKDKSLGGVAIVDITLDDFNNVCQNDKFPILSSISSTLYMTWR